MLDGIYDYFFGANNEQETKPTGTSDKSSNEWIFIDRKQHTIIYESILIDKSGRSSPVMVPEPDMMELEDIESVAGDVDPNAQLKPQQPDLRRLRKIRKEIATQEKKRQVRELIQRRQNVEQKVRDTFFKFMMFV
jgi:hypothetical protein